MGWTSAERTAVDAVLATVDAEGRLPEGKLIGIYQTDVDAEVELPDRDSLDSRKNDRTPVPGFVRIVKAYAKNNRNKLWVEVETMGGWYLYKTDFPAVV